MYPHNIFLGINLYVIFLALGVFAAIITLGKLADVAKLDAKVQNISIFTTILAVVLGYGSAVLFQALYNIAKEGKFVVNAQTGATFYGGLIGGTVSFILIYFLWGKFSFDDDTHVKQFWTVCDIAPASITVGHALGRIGCLMGGCCYGKATDAWYGIHMVHLGHKVVPIQLFEAIFLFALFGLFVYRVFHKKTYNLPIYLAGYGVWRFIIEYFRDDYRGSTFIPFLTPSQLTAIGMIIAGFILFLIMKKSHEKRALTASEESVADDAVTDEKSETTEDCKEDTNITEDETDE